MHPQINHAADIYREDGSMTLAKEATLKAAGAVSRRIAPRGRALAALYNTAYVVHERAELEVNADTVYSFGSSETATLTKPPCVGSFPPEVASVIGTHSFDRPFVAEYRDARIADETGLGVTAEGAVLLDTARSRRDLLEHYFLEHPKTFFRLVRRQRQSHPQPDDFLDSACSLLHAPSIDSGFASWREMLSLLEGVEQYIEETGDVPKIILESDPAEYKLESLRLLGYDESDLYFWSPGTELAVEKLLVPSVRRRELTTPYYSRYRISSEYLSQSPAALKWVRERVCTALKNTAVDVEKTSRVYISREDAPRRRVSNEDEVREVLADYGFESFELAKLSFTEQAAVIANADIVVASHGAGLANLIFGTDLTVLEVLGSVATPDFFMLSQKLGFSYQMARGKTIEGGHLEIDTDIIQNFCDNI